MFYKISLFKFKQLKTTLFILTAGLFLCNFTVYGKTTYKQELCTTKQSSAIYIISTSTTTKDLQSIKKKLERDLNGTLIQFSDIKYNEQKELSGITISTKFAGEHEYRKNVSINSLSSFPIKLSANGKNLLVQYQDKRIIYISNEGITLNKEEKSLQKFGENPLYIINGKKYNSKKNDKNERLLESKDGYLKITEYDPKKAIKKFGEKAKDGAVIIEEVQEIKFKPQETTMKLEEIYATQNPNLNEESANSTNGKTKPLFFIDGEKVTGKELNQLEESKIEKVVVLKDENAIKKYGEKGKNGVIEISLKKEE